MASCNSALFVALWFILFYVLLCALVFFSPFSIAITSLGEERANLSAFHTWFVIATFSGPFSTLRGDLLIVVSCVSLFLCFSVLLALRLPRLGKRERANLSAFRTFVRNARIWFCLFSLPLGVWEGLRFVIVALPGLFSYPFLVYSLTISVVFQTFSEWKK